MKFPKSLVEKIIREELAAHIAELTEKSDEEDKKPETQDSEKASSKDKKPAKNVPPPKPAPNEDPTMDQGKAPGSPPEDEPEEVPDEPDPADDPLEDDGSEDGNEGDDDREGGDVADELTGKRIQSISFEPKSKTVPGASEIVITFDETPDAFKILITKTGAVKYYMRGLHDTL